MFFMFDDKKNEKLPDESCADKSKGNEVSSDLNSLTPDVNESWAFLSRETSKDTEVTGKKSKSRLVSLWNGLKFPRIATEIPHTTKVSKNIEVRPRQSRELSRYTSIKRECEKYASKQKLNRLKTRSKDQWSETALSTGKTEEISSANSNPFLDSSLDYKTKNLDKTDISYKSRDGVFDGKNKGSRGTKDGKSDDTSPSQTLDQNGSSNKMEYFDSRWRSLYLVNDKEQELIPCPTCGRKFSEEAAFRHFPICSRVKQKCSSNRSSMHTRKSRTRRKLNSPNNLNQMSDESEEGNKKSSSISKKSSKPIVYTFQKAGLKIQAKLTEGKPQSQSSDRFSESLLKKSEKKPHQKLEKKEYSGEPCPSCGCCWPNKSGSLHCPKAKKHHSMKEASLPANGTMKSATIWKRSTKEFIKSNTKTRIPKSKTKGGTSDSADSICSNTQETPIWDDLPTANKGLAQASGTSYGLLFHNTTDKNNVNNLKAITKKIVPFNSRSGSKATTKTNRKPISNDFDTVPDTFRSSTENSQNVLKACLKRQEKIISDTPTEKFECCQICGEYFRGNVSTNHIALCERIKKIEESVSEPAKGMPLIVSEETTCLDVPSNDISGNLQYSLSKHTAELATDDSLTSAVTLECPWCQQLLDLRKTQ